MRRTPLRLSGRRELHWPVHVHAVSLEQIDLLGIDADGNLYFDGKQLQTVKRLALQERILAWTAVLFTAVGSIAAGASAAADWLRP